MINPKPAYITKIFLNNHHLYQLLLPRRISFCLGFGFHSDSYGAWFFRQLVEALVLFHICQGLPVLNQGLQIEGKKVCVWKYGNNLIKKQDVLFLYQCHFTCILYRKFTLGSCLFVPSFQTHWTSLANPEINVIKEM